MNNLTSTRHFTRVKLIISQVQQCQYNDAMVNPRYELHWQQAFEHLIA